MKAGFVVLLGRPNVGKSTLLNALLGTKVSIVTPKPQTTRDAIQGIYTCPEGQIVFVDSPGVHEPEHEVGRRMMRQVRLAASGCHLCLLVVEAGPRPGKRDRAALEIAKNLGVPCLLVLNKVDLLASKQEILPRIEQFMALHPFEECVPVSAAKKRNLDLLTRLVVERLPEAPPYYPADAITDQPERFLAAELVREQIILSTEQEVPHSVAVLVDAWDEAPEKVRISATIYVERAGQKAIVIGRRGQMLKEIGSKARLGLEAHLHRKVFLELFVKVKKKWRDEARFVRELDLHRSMGTEPPDQGAGTDDRMLKESR